jgi:hypothetical protein
VFLLNEAVVVGIFGLDRLGLLLGIVKALTQGMDLEATMPGQFDVAVRATDGALEGLQTIEQVLRFGFCPSTNVSDSESLLSVLVAGYNG